MKLFQLPIKIALVLTWFSIATSPVFSQSGRMSDITMPNPGEVAPETPDDVETPIDEPVTGDDDVETPIDEPVAGDDLDTDTPTDEPVAGDDAETPTDEPVAGDDAETPIDEPVAGDDAETPIDEPVAGDDAETPIDEPVAGDDAETPTDETVAGDDVETPTDEPVAGDDVDTDTPTDEPVAGDDVDTDTPTDDTPMEEAIMGDEEITPEDNIAGDNGIEASTEDAIAGGNDTTKRQAIDENVMEAIADDSTPELEVVTTEINQQVQSDSIETETNLNSDTPSQSAVEDSVEQNVETGNEVDSQQTASDNTENTTEAGNLATEEATTDNTEITEETTIENTAETENVATEETTTDNTEITEETTADSASETDNVAEELEDKNATASEETEEEVASEETEEEVTEETEEELAEESESSQDLGQEVDRIAYEVQVQESPTDIAIQMQEEFQLTQLMGTSGLQIYGQIPSVKEISSRLAELGKQTGKNPAFVNISLQSNQLEAFVVLPESSKSASKETSLIASTDLNKIDSPTTPQALTLRETVKDTSRKDLIATATKFREEVSDSSKLDQSSYLKSSQELYKVLIEPIEAELEANNIDILVFSMDSGLRLLPLAALHDGEQFLIEKYAVATVPSFGLTDTRYVNLNKSPILAMGASEFTEQAALPTMAIELETIVSLPRQGEVFINEQFTIENFKAQNRRENPFPIIHLGTHAEFKAGSLDDSYIQFYDDRLKIPQLQDLSDELGWNSNATPIELLVLSACETALGDEKAELGFAGLAVQAGVKSALASLWYVSDVGTLALMGEFYDQLSDTLVKAEALRQTQLKMLGGDVKVDNKQVEVI